VKFENEGMPLKGVSNLFETKFADQPGKNSDKTKGEEERMMNDK